MKIYPHKIRRFCLSTRNLAPNSTPSTRYANDPPMCILPPYPGRNTLSGAQHSSFTFAEVSTDPPGLECFTYTLFLREPLPKANTVTASCGMQPPGTMDLTRLRADH